MPESAKQFRPFAILNDVLRELSNVEVECDDVVDVANFASDEFRSDVLVSLSSSNYFAPDFRAERELARRDLILICPFGNITGSSRDVRRKRFVCTVPNRRIDVSIRISA